MRWFRSRPAAAERPDPRSPFMAHPRAVDEAPIRSGDAEATGAFLCSTCGRTDLPEAGGWDPPICLECDAAINFDWEEFEAESQP